MLRLVICCIFVSAILAENVHLARYKDSTGCSDEYIWCAPTDCSEPAFVPLCLQTCGLCEDAGTTEGVETTEEEEETTTGTSETTEIFTTTEEIVTTEEEVTETTETSEIETSTEDRPIRRGPGTIRTTETPTVEQVGCRNEIPYCISEMCLLFGALCRQTCGHCGGVSSTTAIPEVSRTSRKPSTTADLYTTTEESVPTTEEEEECRDHTDWCEPKHCTYMADECRKTCGGCEDDQSTTEGRERTTQTVISTEVPSMCRDERKDCTQDACRFYGTSRQCKSTCGLCGV